MGAVVKQSDTSSKAKGAKNLPDCDWMRVLESGTIFLGGLIPEDSRRAIEFHPVRLHVAGQHARADIDKDYSRIFEGKGKVVGVRLYISLPDKVRSGKGKGTLYTGSVTGVDECDEQSADLKVVAENLSTMASSMFAVMQERQEHKILERLTESVLPRTPAPPRLLKKASMQIKARKVVLESGDWLTAADIAKAADLSLRNPSAQPNKWKRQGQIFAVHHRGVDYFPGYGLDPEKGYRPLAAMADVIRVFGERKGSWGKAYWFASANSFLGGKRPQDLLAAEPERVVAAARDEIEEIAHA